jgi:polyhydroxyalkanoate synthesis regulator phasin
MKFLLLPTLAFGANPIGQVLDLLQKLYDTVVNDGEVENKQFETFAEWCEDQAKERQFEVKTGNTQAESLRAAISKAKADIDGANSRIAELSQAIAANNADLNNATEIRNKEHETFKKEEKDLVQTVDTLRRAQQVLSRHLGQSFAQLPQSFKDLTGALGLIVDAAIFSTNDKSKLKAFLQSTEDGVNAPEAKAYESHSGGILDTLADMQDKAEGLLSDARKAEVNARHAFELLAQSLKDELKVQNEELSNTRRQLAATSEVKGQAEGDLATTNKDLGEDRDYLKDLSMNCQQRAVDHEVSLKGRQEELDALREARKIISEATGAASGRQYKSFIQASVSTKKSTGVYEDVVKNIKGLGKKFNDGAFVQLAGQIRAMVSMDADPFAKVKGLIQDMIQKLITQAQEEASHKAFCDRETSRNEASRNKLKAENSKLATRIEKANAGIAALKQQIADLNGALAEIAKSQKQMDAMRQDEHAEFIKAEADFKQGLQGVRGALKVLREYYQNSSSLIQAPATSTHSASTDSGNGIISILEIAESDFARSLAEAQAGEDDSVEIYEKTTNENKVSTATKKTSVEGKTQESARLAQVVSDAGSDREGVQEQLTAVLEYLDKLRPQCTTEPESYEERKARREHEIEGLKTALDILENETAFIQEPKKNLRKQLAIQ